MPVPTPNPTTTQRPRAGWLRIVARTLLLAWAGFWGWFVAAHLVADGFDPHPATGLVLLAALTTLGWWWPRAGAVALLLFAGWAFSFFPHPAARTLLAAPALALAVLVWTSAPPRRPPA